MEVRNIAKDFVDCMFDVKHVPDSKYGDFVEMDIERSIRFQLQDTGMTQKVVKGGLRLLFGLTELKHVENITLARLVFWSQTY